MKDKTNKIFMRLSAFALGLLFCIIFGTSVHAEEYLEHDYLYTMHATAYCLDGKTCTGKTVREGIAATGRKDWIGKTAILYSCLPDNSIGEFIGIYELEDTGCKDCIIDVWCPEDECQGFMDIVYSNGAKGRVFVQVIEAEG